MSKGSLRLRLLLAAAISIALALSLTGFALVRLFEQQVRERVMAGLENDLMQLAGSVEVKSDGTLATGQSLADPRYQEPYGGRYWRIELLAGPGERPVEPLQSRSLWDTEIDPSKPVDPEGEPLILLQRELGVPYFGRTLRLRLTTATREEELNRPLEELRDQLVVSLAIIGTVLIFGAWLQVSVGLRPLQQLREQVAAIRAGAARRLAGRFPDEVAPLVDELNDVLDMRDASLERARRRAGDLAHGLKTPLTVLSTISRELRKENREKQAEDIDEQTGAMVRHVERALARSRLSSGMGHVATGLAGTLERVLAAVERLPGADRLTFVVEVEPEARVPIEQGDLTELLGNLLDNARKWARTTVRVRHSPPRLLIEDDGPGVPEGEMSRIGERGRRLDESKQGSGLGLSIVEDIADIYGFAVSYGCSELGGLKVEIRL
ncbi:sensor histidine kinase [Aestuariivirga sp.]|uniref:sensor histidine kinase n=1 Tax=Aestuariivirga sp. TaxID=2650926 RepID=UPI00391B99E0